MAGVGELMLRSAHKLHQIGAEFLVGPDNTIHQGLAFIVDCVRPTDVECSGIHNIIMDELVYGVFTTSAVDYFQQVMRRMKDNGARGATQGDNSRKLS